MFGLKIVFYTLEELPGFLNGKRETIIEKTMKSDVRRGQGTKKFHELAKKYRTEHPDKTYRECLKEVSELNKKIYR